MKKKFLEGIVKRHADGFGFLIPDQEHADVYIPKHSMVGIMTNDKVRVEVEPERGSDRFRGEVIKITKRFFTEILGRFQPSKDGGMIIDEGHGWGENLSIKKHQTMSAKEGDFVRVKILTYPEHSNGFTGEVVEVLGKHGDPLLDVKKVIFSHKIPSEFSESSKKEAASLPKEVTQKDLEGRVDLTHLPIVTIDGVTAKDFDDAVLVKQTREGFNVHVAIADVSHYVKPGRPIDVDAYERGTSTYFPNYVVPMLPEELSNELCSLKPNVIRLALVAEMKVNFNGELVSSEFYEGFIKSHARVTYGEAQEIIDGTVPPKLQHVKDEILKANDLAKILLAKRTRDGSIQLEIPETQVVLNDLGEPVDLIRGERIFAHKLIEELMLLANVAVARFFKEHEIAALYRIHEPPRAESMTMLNKYLVAFGGSKQIVGGNLQKKITAALEQMGNSPHAEILNVLTLRAMNQAQYSPDNVGHFGLGFADYAHFTSPIRRYPDLIVHRLLKSQITKSKGYARVALEQLRTDGTHLSGCEQRSTKCERQFYSIKKARFMESRVGKEFEGIVSGVTKFGIFVMLKEYDVDGLIKAEDLGDDRFEYNEESLKMVGKRSGLAYEIGMPLKILVANVDVESGRIEFTLAEGFKPKGRLGRDADKSQGRTPFAKRFGDKKPSRDKRSFKKKSPNSPSATSSSSSSKSNEKPIVTGPGPARNKLHFGKPYAAKPDARRKK